MFGAHKGFDWILPPLSNSWVIFRIWIYKALNSSPIVDCYCMEAVPKVSILKGALGFGGFGLRGRGRLRL